MSESRRGKDKSRASEGGGPREKVEELEEEEEEDVVEEGEQLLGERQI